MIELNGKDQKAKEAVLKQIMDMMGQLTGDKLKGLTDKKPAVTEISVSAIKPKDALADEMGEESSEPLDDSTEESAEHEPTDEEKAQIAALYHKYCR